MLEVFNWINKVLCVYIPRYKICPGHDTPLHYLYDRIVKNVPKTIGWAARGAGKSWLTGLECWFKALYNPRWEAVILGGSLDQSQKSYRATLSFWDIIGDLKYSFLKTEPLLSRTLLKNGASYSISPASTKAVRGPHPNALYIDEFDEIDPVVFRAAMQQPQSKNGYNATWAIISTMHKVGGLMSDWVDNAEARGFRLYTWCILEVMQPCMDYSCSTCVLEGWCHGSMKPKIQEAIKEQLSLEIIEKGDLPIMGYITVEDVISKVKNASIDGKRRGIAIDVDSELFCIRPSRSGLVYSNFDPYVHIIEPFSIPETWVRYRAFDFGFTNPWACIYIAYDKAKDIYYIYDELYETGKSTRDMIPILTDGVRYELQVGDVACPDDIQDLNKSGIKTVAYKQSIPDGLKRVRRLLEKRVDGSYGLYVFKNCVNTTREFESYRYDELSNSEIPVDDNNHLLSALRYLIFALEYGETVIKTGLYV